MVTMIVSSGSITVSVSVVTSSVALVPLFSVTTGVIGMKSVAAVAVPVMVRARPARRRRFHHR